MAVPGRKLSRFVLYLSTVESISSKVLDYHFNLGDKVDKYPIPAGIDWLLPYSEPETQRVMSLFYTRFYNDQQSRKIIFGINPGRFGAGLTGVPFTDPFKMLDECQIENNFPKKQELSAQFIYQVINRYGGVEPFFNRFYITSLCPLGFVKDGINYNYYDDKPLTAAVTPFIIENIKAQKEIGSTGTELAYCLGEGKNYEYFSRINDQHGFFKTIVPLPHPRWIMQYKRKLLDYYIQVYLDKLVLHVEQ